MQGTFMSNSDNVHSIYNERSPTFRRTPILYAMNVHDFYNHI